MEQRDAGQEHSPDRDDNVAESGGGLRSVIRRQVAIATASVAASGRPTGAKAELYRGFGDGFSRAFELAVTPVVFGALGYGLDRWLGILPVLTIVFALMALIGLLLRTWYGYVHRMEQIEKDLPWATRTEPQAAMTQTVDAP